MYRLLYIKTPNVVKYSIGERKLLLLIAFAELFISTLFAIGQGMGKSNSRAVFNICIGHIEVQKVFIFKTKYCSFSSFKCVVLVRVVTSSENNGPKSKVTSLKKSRVEIRIKIMVNIIG